MINVKKVIWNWRVILLITFIFFAILAIRPQVFDNNGITIKEVELNSSAFKAGIESPSPKITKVDQEKIFSINREKINSLGDYTLALSTIKDGHTVQVETDKRIYTLLAKADSEGLIDLGLVVSEAPFSNLRKGLDLEGGMRVLLKPEEDITSDQLELTVNSLKERLNVYGLSDIIVRSASDLSGQDFILIEIAGATEKDVRDLLSKQGKFEAKIGNETVFFGGEKDITYVCRSADCSGINPQVGCSQYADGYACGFFFSITLSQDAAERHAQITDKLTIIEDHLSEPLTLYLDDVEVDVLQIGSSLKGSTTTSVQISGSGVGRTQQEAMDISLENMKRLQTVLITGSLPVKLNIEKMDTISPSLGKEFLNNMVLVAALALLAVVLVVFIRYRKLRIVIPMVLILISEIILTLGFAALVGWNLDLAAIAGIIVAFGTGVNHLIVITDETIGGEQIGDWKRKLKNAMFIVMGAYLTTSSGVLPLWFAGAGLLKGFAFTTLVGLSFGVFIARPAYAKIIEELFK